MFVVIGSTSSVGQASPRARAALGRCRPTRLSSRLDGLARIISIVSCDRKKLPAQSTSEIRARQQAVDLRWTDQHQDRATTQHRSPTVNAPLLHVFGKLDNKTRAARVASLLFVRRCPGAHAPNPPFGGYRRNATPA
jgi:hypothetical protein